MIKTSKRSTIIFSKDCDTYIGPKGYTIMKESSTQEEMEHLKKMLIARPIVMGSMCSGPQRTFPIFRESSKNIYPTILW